MDAITDQLMYRLHEAVALLDKSADALLRKELGVSYAQFYILIVLRTLGTQSQRSLARELHLSAPAVSKHAAALQKRMWIKISADPSHRKRQFLTLTSQGKRLVARCQRLLENRFRQKTNQIALKDMAACLRVLDVLIDVLRREKTSVVKNKETVRKISNNF
jgi:DNA-binding MarR family transcriptional regulator